MGLFDFFLTKQKKKTKKVIQIVSPISGCIIPLEETPDEAFSQKIVGDGVAIDPTGSFLGSPCNGEIGKIFRTNHAFSIKTPEGIELFVHFGMNTLELDGKGFERVAEEGQKVKMGDIILKLDLEFLKSNAESVITPVVISNMDECDITFFGRGVVEAGNDIILEVKLKKS